jgi:hypothetical protein
MRATVDREEFFQFQHGDGRLKLIERLAAAHRAGELPDYMLEFVDSLRTRVKSASFLSAARSVRAARPVPKTRPQLATPYSSLRGHSWRRLIQAISARALRAGGIEALLCREVLR